MTSSVPLDVDEVFSPSDDDITTEDEQSNDSDVTDDEVSCDIIM